MGSVNATFLAGWQASRPKRELRVIQQSGMKWRCFSFANLEKIPGFPYYIKGMEGSYQHCLDHGVEVMMDSGIVSYRGYKRFMQREGKSLDKLPTEDEFVRLYVDFVKANQKNWKFCVTVDMKPIAADVLSLHKKIEAMGIRPVPVYHGDVGVDWLKNYLDLGYNFVCLGGSAAAFGGTTTTKRSVKRVRAQYLDRVFNFGAKHNMEFHGLGLTTPWAVLSYPWRSADSSWWTRSACYGTIMRWNAATNRMSALHISTRDSSQLPKDGQFKSNTVAMQRLREELRDEGFDLDQLREDLVERHIYNARTMMQLAESATKKQRGVWNLLF